MLLDYVIRLVFPALRISALFSLLLLSLPIVLQDFLIFPKLAVNPRGSVPKPPPAPMETFFINTSDSERLEVWRLPAATETARANAIIFHGNGGNLESFVFMQKRLSQAGFNAYSFDYRGYGQSSGWPTEQGLYLDASAVWDAVRKREQTSAKQIILVGYSLGTGIASELATRVDPGAVMMFAPYSSMPDVVSENPDFGYYSPFLFYSFPTLEYLLHIPSSCILVAHGARDTIIPLANSQRIVAALSARKNFQMLEDSEADHVNIFQRDLAFMIDQLLQCGFRY